MEESFYIGKTKKKKQLIPQLKILKISLNQKKEIKQLKKKYLEILEKFLDQKKKIKQL